ncbi:MAG: N-acetyltransferase [Planctomycetota bacterium]|nr:N-acetyltransferase [Planctomycetota bacterium]
MSVLSAIEIRPARRADTPRLAALHAAPCAGPTAGELSAYHEAAFADFVVASRGDEILGAGRFISGAGLCANVLLPRLREWDEALAARLFRAAAARANLRDGARLIQVLTEPQATGTLAAALALAGFEKLALLAYLRRHVRPEERQATLPPDLAWRRYWRLRHAQFARTIAATYEESLDCPGLAGLRTVDDVITTHKNTGLFSAKTWNLAMADGEPAGVVLVNNLQGRGDVIYLGVVPAARQRGIGKALVMRAVRDTAIMGLPQLGLAVDVANTPAMRLYEGAGFLETRRRMAYFIPAERLDELSVP